MLRTKRNTIVLILLIGLLFGLSLLFGDSVGFFDKDQLTQFVEGFGIAAPLALIFLIIVEVIIAPLPGGVSAIVAAIVFGPLLGVAYSWIGNVIGSIIAFYISRRFGDRVVRYFSPEFNMQKYALVIRKYRKGLWLLYAVPALPVDILSFAFGLSDITFKDFIKAISFAFFFKDGVVGHVWRCACATTLSIR